MSGNRYTDAELLTYYKQVYDYYGRQPRTTEYEEYRKVFDKGELPSYKSIRSRFGGWSAVNERLNLPTIYHDHGGYTKEHLIRELKRFHQEFDKIPRSYDFEPAPEGYPSRKNFDKQFDSFSNAMIEAGFDYNDIKCATRVKNLPNGIRQFTKSDVERCIKEFIDFNEYVPSLKEIIEIDGYPIRQDFRRLYGSFNKAIKEMGYKPQWTNHHTDEELEDYFMEFVEKHNRPPAFIEFNNNDYYPSFWCYQNRFGSWNNAVRHYGFEPNPSGTGFSFQFEDGEIIKSRFEYDVSWYLRDHGISYQRDVNYKDYIENYNGRKNCDYLVRFKGEDLFIEIAGFITKYKSKGSVEKDYILRLEDKLKTLDKSGLDYMVLYPIDFENYTLDELLGFLKPQPLNT